MSKTKICDICGKPMNYYPRYRIHQTALGFLSQEETLSDVKDVCNSCYYKFIRFVEKERNKNE